MNYRSSNVTGYTHHGGDFVAHVGSSHGVQLSGGNNGGIVQAVGDDANISLQVLPKGSGSLTLGDSGASVYLAGSSTPFAGFLRQVSSFATPNFATTNAMVMETTHAFTGVNSSHHIIANGVNLSTDCALVGVYAASTAGQVHCRFAKVSTLTVAASTATMRFTAIRY